MALLTFTGVWNNLSVVVEYSSYFLLRRFIHVRRYRLLLDGRPLTSRRRVSLGRPRSERIKLSAHAPPPGPETAPVDATVIYALRGANRQLGCDLFIDGAAVPMRFDSRDDYRTTRG